MWYDRDREPLERVRCLGASLARGSPVPPEVPMQEREMFPPLVDAANFTVRREPNGGWHMRCAARVEGARWTDVEWIDYDDLSIGELVDVLCLVLSG